MADVGNRTFIMVKNYFDSPLRFGVALFVSLVVILTIYTSWLALKSPLAKTNWQETVTEVPGDFLSVDINMGGLFKKYRADHIAAAKNLADHYLDGRRETAFAARLHIYRRVALFGCRFMANSGGGRPPIATTPDIVLLLAQDEHVQSIVDNGKRRVITKCSQVLPNMTSATVDGAVRSTRPMELLNWVTSVKAGRCQVCGNKFESDVAAVVAQLNQLIVSESLLINNARAFLETLDYGISFDFLAGDSYEWIIHLAVFSWIGVITSGFALLVKNINDRKPTGMAFIFITMRAITAPIIGFIVVATITYGLTSEPVALNHSPLFVIFAFTAGYFSESFNLMLREGLNHILPSWGIDPDKIKGAAKVVDAKQRVLTRPKKPLEAGQTLTDLKKDLRTDVVNGLAEAEAKAVDLLTY